MSAREMLELAAKAAGIVGTWMEGHQPYGDLHIEGIDIGRPFWWNPLEDDGDALRLAVKLKIDIDWQDTKTFPEPNVEAYRSNGEEGSFCATEHEGDYRLAIVRAAAEIGKAMQ